MSEYDFNEKYRQRTARLSSRIIKWYDHVDQPTHTMEFLARQLIRSATATAIGFKAACRSRSRSERYDRLASVVDSGDQTLFWLELMKQAQLIDQETFTTMYEEALAILKVMATHRKNLTNA